MFCALGLVFGGAECVGSRFNVLHSQNHFRRYRGHLVPTSCFACPDTFSVVPGWRRVLFSCFARPGSFSTISGASGPVFLFCAPGLVFGGSEGVRSRFHVLRARTRFQRYRGCQVPFHVLRTQIRFRRYQGRRVKFSSFVLPDSFLAILGASGPNFMFSAPGQVFGGIEGVGSRFHDLRS
jgi:hypothetical protein